jgi:hypothetical protein
MVALDVMDVIAWQFPCTRRILGFKIVMPALQCAFNFLFAFGVMLHPLLPPGSPTSLPMTVDCLPLYRCCLGEGNAGCSDMPVVPNVIAGMPAVSGRRGRHFAL